MADYGTQGARGYATCAMRRAEFRTHWQPIVRALPAVCTDPPSESSSCMAVKIARPTGTSAPPSGYPALA